MRNHDKLLFLLIIISFYLFFAFNSHLNITDTVESNYALTAKEMVLSKDWVSPQIYGKYWYDKPIFFYWQTALAFKLFGFTEFAARFWPALMGILSILLIVWFGKKLSTTYKMGLISGLILATSLEFWIIAKLVITDMTLFFFFNGALVCFFLAYRGKEKEKNYYYLFYLFCGLATLTKGPIGFLLPGLIVVLFLWWSKNWSELRKMKVLPGLLLFLISAVPWYYGMYLKHGQDFVMNFFGVHNYLRATVSEHPRDNVFYYYFAILFVGFFPWIAFLPQTLKNFWPKGTGWKNPDQEMKFIITWITVVFLFFQLIATKYPSYTFPILFPLSLLTAKFFITKQESSTKNLSWSMAYISLFSFLILGVAQVAFRNIHYPLGNLIPLFLVIIIGYGYCFYLVSIKKNIKLFLTIFLTTTLLFNGLFIKDILIPFSRYRSAKDIALALKDVYRPGDVITSYGSYQTSAVFYSGKKILALTRQTRSTSLKTGKLSWASKYVMPSIKMEDIKRNKNGASRVLVVLRQKDYPRFLQEYSNQWKIIKQTSEDYLLEKSN